MPSIDFSLYLITDRHQVPGGALLRAVEQALRGGVQAVQLREKDLPARHLYHLARDLRALTRRYGARLLINDRIDVALAVEADGVHLGGASLPAAAARKILGSERLIGVSTHCLPEIRSAAEQGADFVTFGPVYPTPSKAPLGDPVGIEALRAACAASPIPVFALGGVKIAHLPAIRTAGAAGAALISAVLASSSPENAADEFLSFLKRK